MPCPALPAVPCPTLPALTCPALPCLKASFSGQIQPYLRSQVLIVKSAFFTGVGTDRVSPRFAKKLPKACQSLLSQLPHPFKAPVSNPDRVRRVKCLLETLSSRRAAGTGREDLQPHTNPSQLRFALTWNHLMQSCEEKQRARKPPLRGVWGVNPKP